MASIGEQLRQAREARGISIQEVEQATRIRRVFLQALEDNRPQDLPDPTYVRGFVRNYARFVGLDPEPLIKAYAEQSGAQELVVPTVLDEPLFVRAGRGLKGALLVLLAALLVAAAAWGAYSYLYLHQTPWPLNQFDLTTLRPAAPTATVAPGAMPALPTDTPLPTATLAVPTQTPAPSPTPVATRAAPSSLLPTPGTAAAPLTGTPATTPGATPTGNANLTPTVPSSEGLPVAAGFTVKLLASGYTWLDVYVDEQQEFIGYLNTGDERSWTGERSVELRIGNAAAVSVEVNGTDVGPVGGDGEVRTLLYTADNLP